MSKKTSRGDRIHLNFRVFHKKYNPIDKKILFFLKKEIIYLVIIFVYRLNRLTG